MAVHYHEEDLPADVSFADGPIAIDTEAMGLVPGRDRLCLVQLSDGSGDEHLVRFGPDSDYSAPNLKADLECRVSSAARNLEAIPRLGCLIGQQFAHQWDHLRPVQLDVFQQRVGRQARHAEFQIESVSAQGLEVGCDLLSDRLG